MPGCSRSRRIVVSAISPPIPLRSANSPELAGDQLHVSYSHRVAQVDIVKRIKGRGPESHVPVLDHADDVGHVDLARVVQVAKPGQAMLSEVAHLGSSGRASDRAHEHVVPRNTIC